jgi:hypothetical protein
MIAQQVFAQYIIKVEMCNPASCAEHAVTMFKGIAVADHTIFQQPAEKQICHFVYTLIHLPRLWFPMSNRD